MWGVAVVLENMITGRLNYAEKLAISKFWSDLFWGMMGVGGGGGLGALQ